MKPSSITRLAALLGLAVAATTRADGIDFIIYQTADGQLALAKPDDVAEPYPILPGSRDDLAGYYLGIEPGWDGLGVDEPDRGRFALADGAEIVLRRVESDPGFAMFNLEFDPILGSPDDEETLEGEPELEGFIWHEHLVFGIEPGQPLNKEFQATFVASDLSGQHADSNEFTLRFVTASRPVVTGGGGGRGCAALGLITVPAIFVGMLAIGYAPRLRPLR
jgi:hypothetical protein